MTIRQFAQSLGRRGGLARAKRLSSERRKQIASMGGRSRALSRHAVQRIEDNFRFIEAVEALKRLARFFRTASQEDLLRLKNNLSVDRRSAANAQDLEFLRNLLKSNN